VFRSSGSGFRALGVGRWVSGVRFRVWGSGFRVQGLATGLRFQGSGFCLQAG
jgi:hypothetical protein